MLGAVRSSSARAPRGSEPTYTSWRLITPVPGSLFQRNRHDSPRLSSAFLSLAPSLALFHGQPFLSGFALCTKTAMATCTRLKIHGSPGTTRNWISLFKAMRRRCPSKFRFALDEQLGNIEDSVLVPALSCDSRSPRCAIESGFVRQGSKFATGGTSPRSRLTPRCSGNTGAFARVLPLNSYAVGRRGNGLG